MSNVMVDTGSPSALDAEPEVGRQLELESAYQKNLAAGKPPYARVVFRTRGELRWILHKRDWSVDPNSAGTTRPDLRLVVLENTNLHGMSLYRAELGDANLKAADLTLCYLIEAQLTRALLAGANLTGADLSRANLTRADLRHANLIDSHMFQANLSRAKLDGAIHGHAQPYDAAPNEERKRDLEQEYKANLEAGKPPYAKVIIRTRGELRWILHTRDWSGEHDTGGKERPDFSGAIMEGINLGEIHLGRADLSNADLFRANLREAYLQRVILSGTNLREADLCGSVLAGARMDTATVLVGATLDSHTRLADVVWAGVSLTEVDWTAGPILGDEAFYLRPAKSLDQRIRACTDAARAYRGLAVALQGQGMSRQAQEYRLRQLRLERRVLFLNREIVVWLVSLLLDLLAAYGERLRSTVRAYAAVIFLFAATYYLVSNYFVKQPLQLNPYESFVLSISSFHGRGFFPSSLKVGDPLAGIAAVEAVVGLLIEALFIAGISRRFLSS
jgi:uncharacterized protein YjbI with pentapeptide repeats